MLALAFLCVGFEAPAKARRAQPAGTNPASLPIASSLEGNFLAAYIAGSARDTAAASVFYREALKDDPGNAELLERAFIAFLADGDMPSASKAAEKLATARGGSNALAQLTLGVRAMKGKQFATARSFLTRPARGRAADLTATLLTAWSYAGSRDAKRAIETASTLGGERGFAVFRDYHTGLIAELVGNEGEARSRLKAAYEAEKTTLRVVDAYARFLARHGETAAAIEIYKGYETVASRHPLVRAAVQQLEEGKTPPPIIASAQDGAAEVLYGLGSVGSQQGDELASAVYLRLALFLNPDHALALVSLADTLERMKHTAQAIDVLRRIPAGSPLKPSSEVQIGLSLEQLNRGDEAVKQLDRLVAERPDDTEALVALGNVQRSRKNYAEAAEIYGRAIAKTPEGDTGLWPLYYYRGTAYERAKDWVKAESDLKTALKLVPDSLPLGKSQVLNYLGYSWVDQNINIDEAFGMLRRAVELNPRDGMIIDSLGWAYYRLGQYEDAVRELEKAVELKSGDAVINDHLGDAYWHVGRKLEAKFQWQHAKDSSPEPDDLKKIEEKLVSGLPDTPKPAEAEQKTGEPAKSGGG